MKLLGVCHVVQPAVIYGLMGPNISIRTPFFTLSVGVLPMKIKRFVILTTLQWGFEPYLKSSRLKPMIA